MATVPAQDVRASGEPASAAAPRLSAPLAAAPLATAPPPDTRDLAERLAGYAQAADGALAPNTVRAVRADLGVWSAWCAARGCLALPAAPADVAAFVGVMGESRAPATVRRYVASLALLHRAAGVPDPTKAEVVRLALKRLARTKGTRQRQAAPLTEEAVERIVARAGDRRLDLRDVALLLVARDLLARRSELVALDAADVAIAPDGSGTVLLRRSKTDQEGKGSVGYLAPRTVAVLQAWLTEAGITEGPVFRSVHRTGRVGRALDAGEVGQIFKKLARRAGLARLGIDPEAVSGHSCRVGMAQDLVAFGAGLPAVMQAGRWTTPEMPARYAERQLAGRNAVAQFHARRGSR